MPGGADLDDAHIHKMMRLMDTDDSGSFAPRRMFATTDNHRFSTGCPLRFPLSAGTIEWDEFLATFAKWKGVGAKK